MLLAAWPRPSAPVPEPLKAEPPPARWRDVLWRAGREFNDDNIPGVAGGVSFFVILAVFPGLAAFVSLYGLVGDVAGAQAQLADLAGLLPADALMFIGDEMLHIAGARSDSLNIAFFLAAALSVWSANAGMKALIQGLNVAYEQREKRGFIALNLISLTFTLGALITLVAAMLAVLGLPVLLPLLNLDPTSALWSLLRWPALLAMAVGGLSLLYRFGPCRKPERWRWVSLGGVAAGVLWLGVSALFSWYVAHVAHLNATYGSIGAMIGFMTWIWLTVIVVLAGAELNAELDEAFKRRVALGLPVSPAASLPSTPVPGPGSERG